MDPEYKRIDGETKPEKHALRALFDGEIPEPVLWRTKETQMPKTPTLNLKPQTSNPEPHILHATPTPNPQYPKL